MTRDKYKCVISSFLVAASTDGGTVSIPQKDKDYEHYGVGLKIIKQVVTGMVEQSYISKVAISGQRFFYQDDDGKDKSIGISTQYRTEDKLLNLGVLEEAAWIETGRPSVLISKAETKGKTYTRRSLGKKRQKLTKKEMRNTFGRDLGTAVSGVKLLVKYWKDHPLYLPPAGNRAGRYAASATRIYHNGRMDSGGRYYGAWTNVHSNTRLKGSIDGEALVQIDLNASQPTLFSSLMGEVMEVGSSWEDLYSEMLRDLVIFESKDTDQTRRNKMKQVTVEVIGTGNIIKQSPSPDSNVTWGKDNKVFIELGHTPIISSEFNQYRQMLHHYVPALSKLDGSYYNGAGFISFHEAQVMQETLIALVKKEIVAYPIHDCLLVKKSNQYEAIQTYRNVIRSYVLRFNRFSRYNEIDITIPVSIEESGKDKIRIAGCYNSGS